MSAKSCRLDEVFPEVNLIGDSDIRRKVELVWNGFMQATAWARIEDMPTSKEIPYPHIPHNKCVLKMALAVADAFEECHGVSVNRDVLIAGAILQDVSKFAEFAPGKNGEAQLTEIGGRFPHAFWGAHKAAEIGLPNEIVEIILKHTPSSAQFPKSVEGKILYYVDQLDVIAIYKDRWRKELFITK